MGWGAHDGILLEARVRDLGGFTVRRLLPARARRLVGPFIYFDEMGPVGFAPGEGLDVPPHPHVGLETVTYLFEGEILHRDSLGSLQSILPGDINWMSAGRGIVHSERSAPEARRRSARLHGLQLWVGLPRAVEEKDPRFRHHPASELPGLERAGARLRVLAGRAYGVESPVLTASPLFYVDASVPAGAELELPDGHEDRAVYVVSGSLVGGIGPGRMVVFPPGPRGPLRADSDVRAVLLGGAPLDGPRHIEWNFVSSDPARIERAKRDWKEGRFPKVPGDDVEAVPLPE
jgi:redox-sensitive bicupin YhaK (pirin superfamily)